MPGEITARKSPRKGLKSFGETHHHSPQHYSKRT
jgi:hypothetical protein